MKYFSDLEIKLLHLLAKRNLLNFDPKPIYFGEGKFYLLNNKDNFQCLICGEYFPWGAIILSNRQFEGPLLHGREELKKHKNLTLFI